MTTHHVESVKEQPREAKAFFKVWFMPSMRTSFESFLAAASVPSIFD
jgi:hypothetical protein